MQSNKFLGKPKQLTALDLFCGAGGLTLGLKQAGFKVLAGVEVAANAAETYRKNHPEVVCIENDIREVCTSELIESLGLKKGELSLLAGCPPCQGFSTLRTRKKSHAVFDDRNELIFEYLRFVDAFRPRALMMENVPALKLDGRMSILLSKLAEFGYLINEGSVRIEDAANYGVPQRRKRMILQVTKQEILPVVHLVKKTTVRMALNKAKLKPVGISGDALHDNQSKHGIHVMDIIKAIPKDGGGRASLPKNLVLDCHKNNPGGFKDVYGRMKWDDVAPTMTGGCGNPSKGRFLHPEENRAISLREAAILQTFPKNYWFSSKGGRAAIALLIGNALPPEFIRKHAVAIASALTRGTV
jgi:DNA (cytosine-5)-methyltransferase 1